MKILFITPKFPPDVGGAAHVFGMLSKNISKKHSVTVATSSEKGFVRRETADNVKVYRLFPYYGKIYQKLVMLPLSFLLVAAFFIMNFRKFDVVESHTVGEVCLFGQFFSKLFRKPLIKHVIDMKTPGFLLRHPLPEFFVCCGDCIKERIEKTGINEGIIETINLPLQKTGHKSFKKSGRFRFVFVGEISKNKGVEDILFVLNRVDGDFEFVFIGDGPLIEELRKKAGKDKRIVVAGKIDNIKILEILKTSDVLVQPSYSDVMPISILEAMMHGNAIIASNIGDIRKNVGSAGFFMSPGDRNMLEYYMKFVLKNNIAKMKKSALRNFDAYIKEDVYGKNVEILERAMKVQAIFNK